MTKGYHETRLPHDPKRDTLWSTLWQHSFKRLVPSDGCVLDLGCGHGSFINAVTVPRRIAVDSWAGMRRYAAHAVEAHVGNVTDLSFLEDGSVDFTLASNLFEHLSKEDLSTVLAQLAPKLSAHGMLAIVQPNYRYAHREYYDDYTHVTAWSHVSLGDFLSANNYDVLKIVPRFLPLTIKSRLPVHPWLIAAYLSSPLRPLAKQMLLLARPAR